MNRLEIKNISKNFGGVRAVDDFSMTLKDKDIVSIIGPNGAGKTTIFNLISGVYKINGGEIYLDGGNILNKSQHEIARAGIARTFQNIRLFKGLSVLENVMTAKDPALKYNIFDSLFYTPRRRKMDELSKEECMHYLEVVGLKDLRNEKPQNLPYGTQRKLEIARALATNPKVLLLDEPAAGLNPSEVAEFIELIRRLRNDFDFSILLIEHRMQVVMELSRWIYVQNFGKTIAEGTPKDIQNNPEVTKAYIGEEDEICLV
jgi:branched-chain amino acid transport system ATP-binding protein